MNRNALRAIILLGGLLATAQAQATAPSAAFQDPAEAIKFYNKGLELRDAGKLQAAAESFKKVIEIDPNWPWAHLDLGMIYARLNDFPAAIKAFTKTIELDPNFAEAHSNLGFVYFATGANDAAIKSLQEALRLKPDLDPARRMLVAVYERVGRKEDAEKLSKSERTPNDPRRYYMRGLDEVRLGNIEEALAALRKAVELDANFTEAHALLAEIYMRRERYTEAIPAFERVLASRAEDDATLYNLGYAYWKANRFEESAEALQRAIKVKPDNAQLYELLSHVYIRAEKYMAAKEALNTLLKLKPDDASAYQRLAGAHFMLKQPDEGIAARSRSNLIKPKRGFAWA